MRKLTLAVPAALAALAIAAPGGASADATASAPCYPSQPLTQCVRETTDEVVDTVFTCVIYSWCLPPVGSIVNDVETICELTIRDCPLARTGI